MAASIVLPWSHRAFSLLKRWALGTYHGLRRKHVDAYLNEFVFRYNRRFHRHVSFETILVLPIGRPSQRDKPLPAACALADALPLSLLVPNAAVTNAETMIRA